MLEELAGLAEKSVQEGFQATSGGKGSRGGLWGCGGGTWASLMDRQEELIRRLEVRTMIDISLPRAQKTNIFIDCHLASPTLPSQKDIVHSHTLTIGLCFLVAKVMTPWQRLSLHLNS